MLAQLLYHIEINTDGTLEVNYFDYGNEGVVSSANTRPAATFMEMPRQGVTCLLSRIDYSAITNPAHHDLFLTMCLNRVFTAMFVKKSGDGWSVELFHDTGVCVTDCKMCLVGVMPSS